MNIHTDSGFSISAGVDAAASDAVLDDKPPEKTTTHGQPSALVGVLGSGTRRASLGRWQAKPPRHTRERFRSAEDRSTMAFQVQYS
jgi:hypothetical protein